MNKINLSIVIPSFDRFDYLVGTLDELVRCKENTYCLNVDITVLDNASTDARYVDILGGSSVYDIKYVRNTRNIGLSANLVASFLLADGDFIWLLSDDDALKVDSFDFMYAGLIRNPDVYYLRSEVKGHDRLSLVEEFNDLDSYLKLMPTLSGMGFITSNVYRSDIKEFIEDGCYNIHTLFPHVAMLFSKIKRCRANSDRFCVVLSPVQMRNIVSWTPNRRSYNSRYYQAIAGFFDVIGIIGKPDGRAVLRNLCKDFAYSHVLRFFVLERRVRHHFIMCFGFISVFWLIFFALSELAGRFVVAFKDFYRGRRFYRVK